MPLVNLLFVQSLWDLHNSLLGLTLSLSLTGSITNLVKVTVGRPRPGSSLRLDGLADYNIVPSL